MNRKSLAVNNIEMVPENSGNLGKMNTMISKKTMIDANKDSSDEIVNPINSNGKLQDRYYDPHYLNNFYQHIYH